MQEKNHSVFSGTQYDAIIIGGGPAGLSAAIYLARAKLHVLVIEKGTLGGQIALTSEVKNYPGVDNISGAALAETMRRQAESFGAEFLSAEASQLHLDTDIKTVHTTSGDYHCRAVLLATGARPRTVGFLGETEYTGRGVSYCATCDGQFFKGKELFVVGGSYSAAEESVFLTRFARHVTVLIRRDDFTCAESVAERTKNHEKITVLPHTVLDEVSGENGLQYIRYHNTLTGLVTEHRTEKGDSFGVFVFAGYMPDSALAQDHTTLDEKGYIIVSDAQETEQAGLFAAGDVCRKRLRQVITAAADGAVAAAEMETYLSGSERKNTPARP
ncbi:MAG: FAD-dependent oxidoreductase [Ruminococcaceae bacterium]|nr:FAD-dependent oxidoreductase [Oscillospiraceae bacterium]